MLVPSATSIIIIFALISGQTQASAVKGYSPQQQQAPIKSPAVQQQLERQAKSASPAQAAPILESSKKVYNDESIRRSASQQQQLVVEPIGKSSAPVVVAAVPAEPVKPVAAAPLIVPVVKPAEPAVVAPVASAPVPVVNKIESEQPPVVEAKSEVKPMIEKQPAADELPAQSVRSAPIKDEQPSKVVVEQVVPSKVPEQQLQFVPVPIPVSASVAAPVVAPVAVPVAVPVPVAEKPIEPVVVAQPPVPVAAPVQEPVKPVVPDSPLQAKKDEQVPSVVVKEEPASIEVPAPDPGLVLSEPIDSTTKLLIDLDEHVQKFLPAEDKQEPVAPAKDQVLVSGVDYSPPAAASVASGEAQPIGKSDVPLKPYSSVNEPEPIVPPLPQSIEKVEKASNSVAAASATQVPAGSSQQAANTRQASNQNQNQQQVITQLLDQLDSLQNRIQDTINQLVARRRYVMSALLRPMGTYVRRVRTNLERLQTRVNQLQAAAVSVGGNPNGQRPGGFVDAAAIETIRRRIDDISKRISDIVNRIRFSLTPTSAPLNNNGK